MFTRGAEEAMRKLKSKVFSVVPQTVPQLTYQGAESGTKFRKGSAPNTLPLNAIRGILAERGENMAAAKGCLETTAIQATYKTFPDTRFP